MDFFDNYTHNYDLKNPKLKYKYYHSIRVMDNMELIAKNMSLPQQDIILAKCIGILHDIGRFEQYKKNNNFEDAEFDHGAYGVKAIKENNALKYFDIDEADYEVVYQSIYYHNKFAIGENLTSRCQLFAKMIRDADKLDILYALGNKDLRAVFEEDNSEISAKVKTDFFQNKIITKEEAITSSDDKVLIFAFPYDINFKISLEIIKENKYYEKILKRSINKNKFKPYIEYINNYINERTD